jgi:hypothetical protein
MRDLAAKAEQATRVTELRGTLESLQMEWGDKLTWTSPERDVEQVELPPKR